MYNFETFGCSNESSFNSSCHFWNHKVRFYYLNIASLFSVMKDNSFVFFLAQTSYSLDINSSLKWNFRTFEWICLTIPKSGVEFEEKFIFCFKNDKNLVNFDLSTKRSKKIALIGPFCAKYPTFDRKKYRRVTFHGTEESYRIWRKTDLWFGKWHEEFGKFSSEHLKVSKLIFSWNLFLQSRKPMSYNLQKSYKQSEEKLTCRFKIDIRNLMTLKNKLRFNRDKPCKLISN